MSRIAAIVLAGGESRRMGRPKALLDYHGRTFIDAILDTLATAGTTERIVVLGHEPDVIRTGARLADALVVVNADYPLGQFSSLRCGVTALEPGNLDAVIVALVDQPQVPAAVVSGLIDRFVETGAPIVRPVHAGRGGHPILLSAETFSELLALPPTATTFDLVRRFAARRVDLPVEAPGLLEDFDTPEDLSRLD